MTNSLQVFRKIALAEGISFLVLLFIAMPMKYMFAIPLAVKIVGWTHGVLFMAYLYFEAKAAAEEEWSFRFCIIVFVAALLPFGTIVLDRRLRR